MKNKIHYKKQLFFMEITPKPTFSIAMIWFLLFLIFSTIHQSLAARTLLGNASPGQANLDHAHLALSFSMPDVLSRKHPSLSKPGTTRSVNGGPLPFSKPLGFYPPNGATPFANLDDPVVPTTGLSSQTLDLEGISVSFPAVATLHELELGTVTPINQDIYDGSSTSFLGRAQGIYVASSEDGSSHMMALTTSFMSRGAEDCLRFFGVHRTDVVESHVAVIGGNGKYHNANGYATIRIVNISSTSPGIDNAEAYKLLSFNVYLG